MAAVLAAAAAMAAFSSQVYEPHTVPVACAAGQFNPVLCAARQDLGFLVHYGLVGSAALLLGLGALRTRALGLCVAASIVGLAGVFFYNVSWGMTGAWLGVWAGLRPEGQGASPPGPNLGPSAPDPVP